MANYRYPRENIKAGIDYLEIQVVQRDKKTVSSRPLNSRQQVQIPSANPNGGLVNANLRLNTSVYDLLQTQGFAKNSNVKPEFITDTIILPMPSNITDSNQVSYSDDSLDAVTAEVAGYARGLMDTNFGPKFAEEAGQKTLAFMNTIGQSTTPLKDIYLGNLAASAAQIAGVGNITLNQILARGQNQILNPNMELLFNSPTIRNFKFSFKMTPRDESESREVKNIIRTFKKNMAPKDTDKFFLTTPNIFKLEYLQTNNKEGGVNSHQFLHKFKQCALTDITVNYTGENIYATYADGTPVSIIMDLTFKELEPIYSSDYETSEGKEGVGY
jgi:hypothetical protein